MLQVSNGTFPVIFWLHGGSWKFGSGGMAMYGPGTLMSQDIVLVTLNYRLGPLGKDASALYVPDAMLSLRSSSNHGL